MDETKKPDDAQIDAILKVAARSAFGPVEWVPAGASADRIDRERAKVGEEELTFGSRQHQHHVLTAKMESWGPLRAVEMSVDLSGRPTDGHVELLVRAIVAAHDVLEESFQHGDGRELFGEPELFETLLAKKV